MSELPKHNLAFFLTQGMSLKRWQETGILNRGLELFTLLGRHFKKVYIFTYGDQEELGFSNRLPANVTIIANKYRVPAGRYVFSMPFAHRHIIRQCSFFRTEQMQGSQSAIIAKLIHPSACLIIRTGYSLTYFHRKAKRWIPYLVSTLLEFTAYRLCDAGLVTSRETQDQVVVRYFVSRKKIHLTPNYINTDIFSPDPQVKKYSQRIICISRFSREKNIGSLIAALKGTGLELDLIGKGKAKDQIDAYAKEMGVKVNFLGIIPNEELPKVLRRYEIYVLPSLYEGMPKTLLEAMSCGLACIGTKVAGIREVIADRKTGMLSDADSRGLAASIHSLFEDPDLRRELGREARKFIIDNFSIKSQLKKELQLYERMAKNN